MPLMMALSLSASGQTGSVKTNLRPMLDRLASEAAAYAKLAAQVSGQETLHQREMMKPQRKFKPRVGEAATTRSTAPEWNEREIISLYAVTSAGGSLHEIRQVMFVDGRMVQDQQRAQHALTTLLTASGDQQKLASLKQIQKDTLGGAVTDFGPLILLFARGGAERYEFTSLGARQLGTVYANGFHFKQLDGTEGLTLFSKQTQKLPIEGDLLVSEDPSGPIRITLSSTVPDSDPPVREEATVDYARSSFGALLPMQVEHVEYSGTEATSEHIFEYDNFQKLANR